MPRESVQEGERMTGTGFVRITFINLHPSGLAKDSEDAGYYGIKGDGIPGKKCKFVL